MIYKTIELTGLALEFAAHKAMGAFDDGGGGLQACSLADYIAIGGGLPLDWEICGPIIELEKITIFHDSWWEAGMNADLCSSYGAACLEMNFKSKGDTAIVAAMRCFVFSKMGAEVEL